MSTANPFRTESAVAASRAFRRAAFLRLGVKIGWAFLAMGALLALGRSGHGFVAAWLGLMLPFWGFFIGVAKASADED